MTGSAPVAKTIGIVVVTPWRRRRCECGAQRSPPPGDGPIRPPAPAADQSDLARSGIRSSHSGLRLPVSFRPWRKPWRARLGKTAVTNPITGFAGCCARAANGHAAAPPIREMNSRRLMCFPQAGDHTLPYPWKRRVVHHSILAHPTSATGQRRRSCRRQPFSAFPLFARKRICCAIKSNPPGCEPDGSTAWMAVHRGTSNNFGEV